MARKKTKKQKIKASKKVVVNPVTVSESGIVSIESTDTKKTKIKSTPYTDSQVSLIYKDLLKTAAITLVVFSILLSIFLYVR